MSEGSRSIRCMTKRALLLFVAVIGLCIATPTLLSAYGSNGVDCKTPTNMGLATCVTIK